MTDPNYPSPWQRIRAEFPEMSLQMRELPIAEVVTAVELVHSPQGRQVLALGLSSGDIRFWDLDSGKLLDIALRGHTDRIVQMTSWTAPDGSILLASADDLENDLRIWSPWSDSPALHVMKEHQFFIGSLAHYVTSEGAVRLVSSDQLALRVWDTQTGKEVACRHRGDAGYGEGEWFSKARPFSAADGRIFFAVADAGHIRIIDAQTLRTITTMPGCREDLITDIAIYSDAASHVFIASAARNGSLILHDPIAGSSEEIRGKESTEKEEVSPLTFLSDNKGSVCLAMGGVKGEILIWDIEDVRKEPRILRCRQRNFFDPYSLLLPLNGVEEGAELLSLDCDGKIKIWALNEGNYVGVETGAYDWKESGIFAVNAADGAKETQYTEKGRELHGPKRVTLNGVTHIAVIDDASVIHIWREETSEKELEIPTVRDEISPTESGRGQWSMSVWPEFTIIPTDPPRLVLEEAEGTLGVRNMSGELLEVIDIGFPAYALEGLPDGTLAVGYVDGWELWERASREM